MTANDLNNSERHLLPRLKDKFVGSNNKGRIGIKISPNYSQTYEGQLLLWMTANLCSRIKHVVNELELVIPRNTKLLNCSLNPFTNKDKTDLRTSITSGCKLCTTGCDISTSENNEFAKDKDAIILLGHDVETKTQSPFKIMAVSDGWLAFVGNDNWQPKISYNNTENPFGAFSAACIAVGDTYKILMGGLKDDRGAYASKLCFSSYDFTIVDNHEAVINPKLPMSIDLGRLHIIGSGAVAHSFSHVLYSLPDLTADLVFVDRKTNEFGKNETVEQTNLNRYIMATKLDIGKPKAELLAKIMNNKKSVSAVGFDDSFENYVNHTQEKFERVLSCVDKNNARHAIQGQLPRLIYGGSTNEMTIQISLYDLSKNTQCLKCWNELEKPLETDEDIIDRLSKLNLEDVKQESNIRGIESKKLINFLKDPKCGTLGEHSIQKFSKMNSMPDPSVGFVSAMSGFMLASEVIKAKLSQRDSEILPAIECEQNTDFYFNFWYDSCSLNKTMPRKNCWCNLSKKTPRQIHQLKWRY